MRKPVVIFPVLVLLLSGSLLVSAGVRNQGSVHFWHGSWSGDPGAPDALPADHARADLWKAALALRRGDWGSALDSALPHAEAGNAVAMEYAARSYEALGELETAVVFWRSAGNFEALMQLGQSAQGKDRLEIALAAYRAAWELDPRLATGRLTLVLSELGRPEEAEQVYLRSLDLVGRYDGRRPVWYRGLGRAYVEQARWVEAVAAYEDALATAGYDPAFEVASVHYEIAWAYSTTGRHADAVAAIETAAALDPSAKVFLRSGLIHEAAGRPDLALIAYRRVLEFEPDSKQALEAIERLEAGG